MKALYYLPLLFCSLFSLSGSVLAKKLYVLLPCTNQILVINYERHEKGLIQQLLSKPGFIRLNAMPEELGNRRIRYLSLEGAFLSLHAGTLEAGWSPLASPQHWNQNQIQPEPVTAPVLSAPTPSYADICINQLLHEHCNFPRCFLTHLTPDELRQVKESPNFYKLDGSINTEICTCYHEGECDDPDCSKYHIDFETQKDFQ